MPMDPLMMQPQGNVGPAGPPPAPGGGGQQQAIKMFEEALQRGDPKAQMALKQAQAQQASQGQPGNMAPQGQTTPPPGTMQPCGWRVLQVCPQMRCFPVS